MAFNELYDLWQAKSVQADQAEAYLTARQTPRSTSILAPPELRVLYYTPLRWCYLITGAIEERISIADLVCSVNTVAKWLRKTWRDLDGDLLSSRVHNEMLGAGRSYVAVTSNPDGSPRATMLTAKSTVHVMDPDTGELREALHVYGKDGEKATHYEIGRSTSYTKSSNRNGWVRTGVDDHGYPRIPIVVFSARSSRQDGYGEPVARSVWGLQDSATRVATDGAIAGALMAVPQRVILGASPEEKKQSTEHLYMARLLTLSKSDASIEQFAAAQLQQFSTLLNMYARQAASVTGIPVSMFGVASDANPASGDSQRQDDRRITRRAERISRDCTSSWQLVQQLLLDFAPMTVTDEARRTVSVEWLDAHSPTRAELADMALKLSSAKYGPDGSPLVSREFILEKLGLTESQIEEELAKIPADSLAALMSGGQSGGATGNPGVSSDSLP
jgi:hypothetical protein